MAGSAAGSLLVAAGRAQAQEERLFRHGVASGDPAADSLLIWTRVTGAGDGPVGGRWQVASDAACRSIVASGRFEATAERDHCVKIVATGLEPGTSYYYRFEVDGQRSPIGRTRTLPTGRTDRLDIALACCGMYMFGEFHGYHAIAEQADLDLVLFVGDYIYEYGANAFPGVHDIRAIEPAHDTVTLADYRARYAQWRRDPALQAAHARAPWICMWDDHEMANDDWMHGAQHHDPAINGDWEVRKAAAVRAYLEWMPIRDPAPGSPYGIERSFVLGDLATLVLPETRLQARDRQLTLKEDLEYQVMDARDPARPTVVVDKALLATLDRTALPDGYRLEPDIAGFRNKIADPDRRMVGDKQLAWIGRELQAHVAAKRPWFLLGSPTILSSYVYPDLTQLGKGPAALASFFAMTRYGLPMLNLDAWDGYPAERARLYDIVEQSGANMLVLSGDSHMAWVNEPHRDGRRLGLELSASTITGPSIGELMLPDGPVGEAFARDNQDVLWCDHRAVGYVSLTLRRNSVEGRFVRVTKPRSTEATTDIAMTARAVMQDGKPGGWTLG